MHDERLGCARIGIGMASVEEIDSINILQASLLAMSRAVDALSVAPVMVLVDGNQKPKWSHPCRTVIGGDGLSLSIAAASIIAKVTRDRMMVAHDRSEEHTSELQSLMRISYAVFCLKKKKQNLGLQSTA